jgi:hypothetical protein
VTNNAPSPFPLGLTVVKWTATDPSGNTNTCNQNVTITNANPVISGGTSMTVNVDSTCPGAGNQIGLSATDAEHSGSNLTWSISGQGATGTASVVGATTGSSATICYQPNPGQTASDSFIVRCEDMCGGFSTRTINVTVNGTPACSAPSITSAMSIKAHGGAGDRGIPLGISPASGDVESRSGGPTRIDVTFNVAVVAQDGSLTPGGEVMVSSGTIGTLQIVGGTVLRIDLSGVTDRSCLSVTLSGIACDAGGGSPGSTMATTTLRQRVIAGDTTGNGSVTSADSNQTISRFGATTAGTFRSDVVANGTIDNADLNYINARTNSLPVACP